MPSTLPPASASNRQVPPRGRVLIVEDESIVALDLKLQLQDLGYAIIGVASSGEQALAMARENAPDLVLMDVRLQGPMDGIETARAIRERHDTPVIFLTSHSDEETVRRAARTAPYGYLTKPYQLKELRAGIEVALTKARMERQLREADRWFAHTLQCVADGVVLTDLDARIRFLNPAAETLTGWNLEDATGLPVGEVVRTEPRTGKTDNHGSAAELVQSVLADGRPAPVAHACPLHTRAGVGVVVDKTAGPVNDDTGQRLGAVVVLRDARDRVAREAELRASEERFRSAFDHAPLGMALVSFGGDFIQVNDALCRLLGRTRDELAALRHDAVSHEADRAHESERLLDLAQRPDEMVQFEKRYWRAGHPEPVWTLVSVSMLRDRSAPACHLYQVHDLTEQKRAAEHLAALTEERMRREASEQAHATKTEFLSRVSHEMRTPLNAVIGFSQLLQMDGGSGDPGTTRAYVEHIRAAGEHLLALVQDVLDINRMAQGGLKLDLQAVPLAPVVAESVLLLDALRRSHSIDVAHAIDPALQVRGNSQRLRQVLLNLVSNAIKYNRPGGSVRIEGERADGARVRLTVADTGIGMTPDQLDRLFQPFDRLGAERTKVPGTGLGLVIARALVVEMGGTLQVRSQPRAGTTIVIELPSA